MGNLPGGVRSWSLVLLISLTFATLSGVTSLPPIEVPAQPPPAAGTASNIGAAPGPAPGQVDLPKGSSLNFKNYSSLASSSTNGSSTLQEKSRSVQGLDKDGQKNGVDRTVKSKTGTASDQESKIDQFDGFKVRKINNGTAITEDKAKLQEDSRTQTDTKTAMGEYLETVSNGKDTAKEAS